MRAYCIFTHIYICSMIYDKHNSNKFTYVILLYLLFCVDVPNTATSNCSSMATKRKVVFPNAFAPQQKKKKLYSTWTLVKRSTHDTHQHNTHILDVPPLDMPFVFIQYIYYWICWKLQHFCILNITSEHWLVNKWSICDGMNCEGRKK